jgi:N-acetylmuramoyl-L-alanine amidase
MRGWDAAGGRLWLGLAGLTLLLGCSKPPPAGLSDLYARRPELTGLDVSALHGRRIVIDPGHGGAFAGSRGAGDTREADVNLGVALYLWGLLRDAGADVHLTRASDRDLLPADSDALRDDLAARVALLDSLRPDVFLSLHHNSNAELDRERNAVETYFKLDDAGPSYDLARAVHRRLAGVLGIRNGALRPGNYYVLRHVDTAAVLGEASYLSNPAMESQLRLAEKQLLEAEAYFLGLLDYFSRGVPLVVERLAAADTLRTGEHLELHVESVLALDPLSVQLRVDGQPWPIDFDARTGIATLHADPSLTPGAHDFELRARNVRGNAARAWRKRLHVYAAPARVLHSVFPDRTAPGSVARIDVQVLDAWNRPLADGGSLHFTATDAALVQADTTTIGGNARAYVRVSGAPSAALGVHAKALSVDVPLHVDASAPAYRLARCIDAVHRTTLPNAELHCADGVRERSDRNGIALLPFVCDSLRANRRGYRPWRGRLAHDAPVALEAVFGGHLLGVRIVLDAGGNGDDPTEAGLGISASELSWQVTAQLGDLLHAAGAEVKLTRGAGDVVPPQERVRIATHHAADFYVRLESSLEVGRCARVLHYPGSQRGAELARGVARRLRAALECDSVQVVENAQYVLQQTPCPAIVVQLPGPNTPARRAAAAHPDSLRRASSMLLLGVRTALTPNIDAWPPLDVVGGAGDLARDALAVLDGVEAQRPDARGRVRFEHVAPGTHHLVWLAGARNANETWIATNAQDTTRVELPTHTQQ